MTSDTSEQAGFSLTELMIAMLVTMLISGAVFGLLSAGQGAFRREPELTDRQQNIRLAMDLIQRDIATAGVGVGTFTQVFTPGLNGIGANGPSGGPVDALQIVGSDGECPDVPVGLTNATDVVTQVGIPACFPADGVVVVNWGSTSSRWGMAHGIAANGTTANFNPPQPANTEIPGVLGPMAPGATSMSRAQIVRYQIAVDPLDGVPSLWRSARGGLDPANAQPVLPGPTVQAAAAGWQLVARGIEDLQVTYRAPGAADCPGGCTANPPVVGLPTEWDKLVKEVRVTLWARAQGNNLQGQRSDGGMAAAVRGSLTTATTPRAMLLALRNAPAPQYQWQ